MLLPLLFFLLLSISLSSSLKLPLIPSLPFPTPQKSLTLDSIRLSSLSAPIVSAASSGAGQYLVKLRLGSPPQLLRLVADTGSDLLWSRCSPCRRHCRRRRRKPSFFPRHSASFAPFHCYHPSCALLSPYSRNCHGHNRSHTPCRYKYSYADRSSSSGFFSRETASFAADVSFGCAFNVSGATADFDGAHGVLGLGRGPISFASQAGELFGNKFSYCLMDYTLSPPPTSYLLFGPEANNISGHLRFTPLQHNPFSPTFYYIRILGAYVDRALLPIPSSVWATDRASGNGGTIVDSGTTLTFLPEPAYRVIVEAVGRNLPGPALVPGPPGFDLCVASSTKGRRGRIRIPALSFRVLGGAEYSPPPRNYFTEVAEGIKCLALQPVGPTGQRFGVIGNLMQQGFVFVFDPDESRLGFSHTGCV